MLSFIQAARVLARRPAFTIVALVTLIAAIAVTTSAFSIVNGVLLRPLPFPDSSRLVAVYEASSGRRERTSLLAPARLEDWHRQNRTFTAISGSYSENVTDTSGDAPERLIGRRVMARFFDVYAMAPLMGRTFLPDEERYGGTTAAIISEDYWTRRFGRQPSAVGARLTIGGTGYPIVAVMPRAFSSTPIDVWLPAQISPYLMQSAREARFLSGIGRLKPGVTVEQGRDDLVRVQAALAEQFPRSDRNWSADVRDLKELRIGDYRRPLWMVFAAVALLFAIAVANVAGLVLVQLHRRAPEFAIRAAIGASRRQIVGGVMREIGVLGAVAAGAGAIAAYWLTSLSAAALTSIPRIAEVGVDARALAFTILITLGAAMLFGILPALASARGQAGQLIAAGRGIAGGRHRLQAAMVVAQLALGVVLAGSAGLLARSYAAMSRVDLGIETSGVLTFHVGAAWDEDRIRVGQLQVRLLESLQGLPGVRAAGFTNFLPAPGATLRSQVTVEGLPGEDREGAYTVGTRTVTPGYLRALSIPLISGRWCEDVRADVTTPRVRDAMVNRAFVERFAHGSNILGKHLAFPQQGVGPGFQIAGILADVREDGPAMPAVPYVYVCLAAGSWPDPEYVVRADGDPRALASAIRAIVKGLDATRPVFGMKALDTVLDSALDQPRLNATALTMFAAVAVGLAAVGLYGLLMLIVAQRRRELAVRLALGASPRDLARAVFAGAGPLIAIGLGVGVALMLAAAPVLRAMLFGVEPFDVIAVGGSVATLAVIALLAVAIPARQAARANAVEAMHNG